MTLKQLKTYASLLYFKVVEDVSIDGIKKGDVFYMKIDDKDYRIYVERPYDYDYQVLFTKDKFDYFFKKCVYISSNLYYSEIRKFVEKHDYSKIEKQLKTIKKEIEELKKYILKN